MDLINSLILIVSILALLVAFYSWALSQRAYSLTLFKNRFKLYYSLNMILSELQQNTVTHARKQACDHIGQLILESNYLFGNEIAQNLIKIANQVDPFAPRSESISDDTLRIILCELLSKDKIKNLDSQFAKYLYHPSFKKPIGCRYVF